jgi:hypothetical protein
MLTVKMVKNYSKLPITQGRGIVTGFSRGSRLRLLKRIATIDWERTGKCIFVTLTYPDWCADTTIQERTQQRSQIIRDMEKHLGRQFACLWRQEWVCRKSGPFKGYMLPHWHLVCFGVPFFDANILRASWKRILRSDEQPRINVAAANNGSHATRYLCKYVAKKDDQPNLVHAAYLNGQGRPWGVTRQRLLPLCSSSAYLLTSKAQVGRAMEMAAALLGRHYLGAFTLFSDIAAERAKTILGKRAKTP